MKTKFPKHRKKIGFSLKKKVNSLTFYEKLSLIISFLSALSIGSIFVQFWQTKTNLQASMYATITTETLEMDKIFLAHPNLRPYFYEDKDISEITDDETRHKVMIIAEYQLDYFDLVMTQLDYIPTDKDSKEDKDNWDKYFADSFAHSPALCRRIGLNPDWYMTRLVNLSEENCKKPR